VNFCGVFVVIVFAAEFGYSEMRLRERLSQN